MLDWITRWLRGGTLASFDEGMSREQLIRSARLVVIDDEEPLLISELRSEGFAVEHDREGKDLKHIDGQLYDVAIVDYHGVGQRLGPAQGLDLLRHIRRVSPRTRLIAHTSRSLRAGESEFFTLSHAVLPKDIGLGDSLALVEQEVHKAFSKEHLFEALLQKLNVADPTEKARVHEALLKALQRRKPNRFKEFIVKLGGVAGEKAVEVIVDHLFLGTAP